MKGWKYDAHIKVRPMQQWSGGGGIVVQKRGVKARILFTPQYRL